MIMCLYWQWKKCQEIKVFEMQVLHVSLHISDYGKCRTNSPLFEIEPELNLGPFILWVKLCLCYILVQIINTIKEVNTEYKNKAKSHIIANCQNLPCCYLKSNIFFEVTANCNISSAVKRLLLSPVVSKEINYSISPSNNS